MKKFLLSAVAIILAMGLMGSSFAYFQDTETSTGNTFTAGTLDLKVADPNENGSGGDGVLATWTLSNMEPGDPASSVSSKVWFRNAGSIDADHLEIAVTNTVIDPTVAEGGPESDTEEGTTDMDWVMEITSMTYTAADSTVTDCLALLTDANKNGFIDLDDLESQGIDGLPPPIRSFVVSTELDMTVRFHSSADSDYQGDTLVSTFTFTLNQ